MQRILGLLNQSNSLEHIVRLSNIETEDDLNRCIADQYAVAFTKAQWVARFPKIPPENVVCAQGTSASPFICLGTPFCSTKRTMIFSGGRAA